MASQLKYLNLLGAGKMIGCPYNEQELMAWAGKEIDRLSAENAQKDKLIYALKSALYDIVDHGQQKMDEIQVFQNLAPTPRSKSQERRFAVQKKDDPA